MIYQPEIRLLVYITLYRCQGAVYGTKDPSKGDIIRWQREYMVVESLVVQEVHGIVHGGGNVEGRGNDVVGVRFKGIQVNLSRRQMMKNANKALNGLIVFI